MGALANARAEVGALAFASVVIVTMMAAGSFDPRLIWSAEQDAPSGDVTR
jgi:paraquat-inducible protein A